MRTDEWKDKSPYEKSKAEKEVDKFNDLVKINVSNSPYPSYGIYQYYILVDIYNILNNNIEWVYNFITERKSIIDKQSRYLKNRDVICAGYTSEKVHLKLQFKHTGDLIKHFDLIIRSSYKKKMTDFDEVIIQN